MTVSSADTTIIDKIQYCVDIILKETPKEERLVKQIFIAMLSAYSNRPINLAINAPSGEGKNYILNKVAEMFPESDVKFLGGMTDKALFHRNGVLVIKNNDTGEYEPLDTKLEDINERIGELKGEISSSIDSKSSDFRKDLKHQINVLESKKKDLQSEAKKLIELGHTTLIFLDTPPISLLAGIMPLLSHDKEEVEYEFADTNTNGIKTRTNILRGFPAVIFAQAVDSSYHERFPEIKRRFIFVNPKMDKVKYDAAINLMCDKHSLPDCIYQLKVVSKTQKDQTRSIIRDIADSMIEVSKKSSSDKNNVMIPYIESVNKSLGRDRTFDMTTAKRLLTYIDILPLVDFENRPRVIFTDIDDPLFIEVNYFATFEDLREAMYLMEYGEGLRPYILEWYDDVYLPTYSKLTEPNSKKDHNGNIIAEERMIGLSTRQLADATFDIQEKVLSEGQIRQTYLKPLYHENFIESYKSELDRRSYISSPLIKTKNIQDCKKKDTSRNFLEHPQIQTIDTTIYPSKDYINSWIRGILTYEKNTRLTYKIFSEKNEELSIDQLVDRYYPNPEDYFEGVSNKKEENTVLPPYYSENAYPVRVGLVTTLTTTKEGPIVCPKCGETIDPFYKWIHEGNCKG